MCVGDFLPGPAKWSSCSCTSQLDNHNFTKGYFGRPNATRMESRACLPSLRYQRLTTGMPNRSCTGHMGHVTLPFRVIVHFTTPSVAFICPASRPPVPCSVCKATDCTQPSLPVCKLWTWSFKSSPPCHLNTVIRSTHMKTSQQSNSTDESVRSGGLVAVVSDVETGKDSVQFPLAPLGPKQESITQSHIGKGDWYHAGYHLATTIATPAAYAPLPWAFAMLTWPGGLIAFLIGVAVTWYNSILLASLHEHGGVRHTRYKDLAGAILGKWGVYSTVFFQQVASLGNNITIQIVAGQALKAIYKSYLPDGHMTLQHFIIIFGAVQLLLSQLPNIHALRGLNLLSTLATLSFATVATAMSIVSGRDMDRSTVSYGLEGDNQLVLMSAFAALGTIAFSFGDTVLPEVQATVKAPTQRNMYKGISMCYGIITITYLMVAITGYWAFGYAVNPFVIYSFPGPQWAVTLALVLAVIQILGCYQIYTRPTYEAIEIKLAHHDESPVSLWNAGMRLLITSVYMLIVTTICCMIPFFIDFVALVGALGFTPLDFILPVLLFMAAKKTSLWWKALNVFLAVAYTVVSILGAVGAFYFIIDHARTYQLFADL